MSSPHEVDEWTVAEDLTQRGQGMRSVVSVASAIMLKAAGSTSNREDREAAFSLLLATPLVVSAVRSHYCSNMYPRATRSAWTGGRSATRKEARV
eukprot:g3826.t1